MPPIRTVAILLHERHLGARSIPYRVWAMIPTWRERGIVVEIVWGIGRPIDADLLIPHLDLSWIPDDYWAFIQRHPNVVNRRVRDVRKRAISWNLVARDDAWEGPVIAKTDNNSRGVIDQRLLRAAAGGRFLGRLARLPAIERLRLGWAQSLERYYIFPTIAAVPQRVWRNGSLVVERFLPERDGDLYVSRSWNFFGDHESMRIFRGLDPWVKGTNSVMEVGDKPPQSIVDARNRWGVDYGKIDYVISGGEAVLLDVNTTPTLSGPIDPERIERSVVLADGIRSFEGGP